MDSNERAIFLYKPKFLLGYSRNEAVTEHTAPSADVDSAAYAPLMVNKESDGDFRFAIGITGTQWREMNEYRITSFKGHKIVQEGDRYLLCAYLPGGTFLADMFYGCTALREVRVSDKVKINYSVVDDAARYRIVRLGKQ